MEEGVRLAVHCCMQCVSAIATLWMKGLVVGLLVFLSGCTGWIGEATDVGAVVIVDALALHGSTSTARSVVVGGLEDGDGTADLSWSAQFVLDSGRSLNSLEEDTGDRATYTVRLRAADSATDDVSYRRVKITLFE